MSVFTRPKPAAEPNFTTSSPGLIFQKWQTWDGFPADSGKKFVRTNSRLPFLQNIANAVQTVYENTYANWHSRYLAALQTLGVDTSISYQTVWRLLIGWGSNPTLEAGMTLHHLYGFPYIPGSAVKGLLHHVAEMEVMDTLPDAVSALDKAKLSQALQRLQLVKILFGSIHLEQGSKKGNPDKFGPASPKSTLDEFRRKVQNKPEWSAVVKEADVLLSEHTGGMLCFYDAVPQPGQYALLQTDLVNCHYSKYYGSEGTTPPSDDDSPIPVTFLAVKPGTGFIFPFRLEWPMQPGRDDEEKHRVEILNGITRPSVINQVTLWLQKALGEFGVGAKTAAGYGYFDTGAIEMTPAADLDDNHAASIVPPAAEETITPVVPGPFTSTIKPATKIKGISKEHNLALWQRLATSHYLKKIEGKTTSLKPFNMALPGRKISENGKTLQVFYQSEKFYCQVELKLQGINNKGEAQHLWENVILPELTKK